MPEPFASRLARVTSAVQVDSLPAGTRDASRIPIADSAGCALAPVDTGDRRSQPALLSRRAAAEGALRLQHFTQEVLGDPELHAVMDRIAVVEDPKLETSCPRSLDVVADARLADGTRFEERVAYPLEHARRPTSRDQVFDKRGTHVGGPQDRAAWLWTLAHGVIDRDDVLQALARIAGSAHAGAAPSSAQAHLP